MNYVRSKATRQRWHVPSRPFSGDKYNEYWFNRKAENYRDISIGSFLPFLLITEFVFKLDYPYLLTLVITYITAYPFLHFNM